MRMNRFSSYLTTAFLVGISFVPAGCGHFDKNIYESSFTSLKASAIKYQDAGKQEEVVYITRALLDAEPDNRDVLRLQEDAIAVQPSAAALVHKSLLGSNLTDRVADEQFPVWGSVLLYIPNRLLDLMDIITLEVGLCIGIGAKAQATDFASIGLQGSAGEATIGCNRRHLAVNAGFEEYVHFLPVGAVVLGETRAYTGGAYGIMSSQAGIKLPTDHVYQRARDFWAVGVQTEVAAVAVRAEIHPIEIYDFIAGFALFDPLKDDLGSTRPIQIQLTDNETSALNDLAYQVRSR